MSLKNIFAEKIILPLSDKWTGNSIAKKLEFLLESQSWSKNEIEYYQNEQLKKLISHAYQNVEYYNELFKSLKLTPDDIKTKEDLQKLPILTKDTIRENIVNGKLLASNLNKKSFVINSSSGSTGEPLQFFITKESYSYNLSTNLRGWYNMGYRLGDRYVKLSVNPRSSKIKRLQDSLNNCLYFSSKGVEHSDILRFSELLKQRTPKFLRGYPSTLSVLADYYLKNNIKFSGIKAINTTGEILFPEMKNSIETAFNCKVYDSYSGEGGATMFQDGSGKYHISHEYAITELIDENQNLISYGKGEIITTDLWNYANPFIRYAVKDIIEVSKDSATEGKMFVADKIIGRDVDMLKTPSGKILIVHFFTGYFEWITSVNQFQVVHVKPENIVLKLIPNANFSKSEEDKIYQDIKNYLGNDVHLSIEKVNDIPLTMAGKRKFIIKAFK